MFGISRRNQQRSAKGWRKGDPAWIEISVINPTHRHDDQGKTDQRQEWNVGQPQALVLRHKNQPAKRQFPNAQRRGKEPLIAQIDLLTGKQRHRQRDHKEHNQHLGEGRHAATSQQNQDRQSNIKLLLDRQRLGVQKRVFVTVLIELSLTEQQVIVVSECN